MKLKYILTVLICSVSTFCLSQKEKVTTVYLKYDEFNTALLEERHYDQQDRLIKETKYSYIPSGRKCKIEDSAYYHETKTYEYDENGVLINESVYNKAMRLIKKTVKEYDHKSSVTIRYNFRTTTKREKGVEIEVSKIDTSILESLKFDKGKITEKKVYTDPDFSSKKYIQENWKYKGSFLEQYSIVNFSSKELIKHGYEVPENDKMTIYYRPDLDSIPEKIEIVDCDKDPLLKGKTIYNFDLEGRVAEELSTSGGPHPRYTDKTRYYYGNDPYQYAYATHSYEKVSTNIEEMDCGVVEPGDESLDYNWYIYNYDTAYIHIHKVQKFEYKVYDQDKFYTIGYKNPTEAFVYLHKNKDSILFQNTITREEKQEYDKEKKILRLLVMGQKSPNSCEYSYEKIMETIIDSLKKTKTRMTYDHTIDEGRHYLHYKHFLDWNTEKEIKKIQYDLTGKVYLITVNKYNKKGELISEIDSVAAFAPKRNIEHEYDMTGRRKSTKTIIKGYSEELENFEYMSDGTLKKSIKITTYKKDDSKYCDIVIYEPDGSHTRINISDLHKPAQRS
ncbi:MAG: hypothetical protein J7604_25810 [Sporocytophaga sp.]|uniref:hypothetical protein n=1 Tax=Sporocytophaga sp. TaxID=2231183 RepID=UPI001B2262CC|nr:hypothetical protein [Sporocytophaga sp.]MBO9703647.1 hypothetical protein [Sporocytophaga sp.]